MYSHNMCESAPPWLMASLHGTRVIASITIKAFWTELNFLCLMGQKGEWLCLYKTCLIFLFILIGSLFFMIRTNLHAFLGIHWPNCRGPWQGDHHSDRASEHVQGVDMSHLSADSQSTGCRGEEAQFVPGAIRLAEVSCWVLRRGISDPNCRRNYKYPKRFTLENFLLFLIV